MNENLNENVISPDNNQNERKTSSFNLIIAIATLLIAILGATFAYFTATARSGEGEVTVKSAMVSINFERGTAIKATNLIPSSEKVALSKYQKEVETYDPSVHGDDFIEEYEDYVEANSGNDVSAYLDRRCIDAKGKEVCSVFWFSLKSEGPVGEQTDILASIKVERNEFQNLSYLVYEVEYEKDDEGEIVKDKYGFNKVTRYTLVSTFKEDPTFPIQEDIPFAKFGQIEGIYEEENLVDTINPVNCLFGEVEDVDTFDKDDPNRCARYSVTNQVEHNYQIVIWLEETGYEQLEQGKTFKGTVMVEVNGDTGTTGYTGGRVTGQE